MPLDPATIPPQPAPATDATSLEALLDNDLATFAHTFDGSEHFGERWPAILRGHEEAWEEQGELLPTDLAGARALLFLSFREERFLELDGTHSVVDTDGTVVHEPDPVDAITDGRRAHEAFKHALLARIRELATAQAQR